jgi:hypothetical protein
MIVRHSPPPRSRYIHDTETMLDNTDGSFFSRVNLLYNKIGSNPILPSASISKRLPDTKLYGHSANVS